MFVSGFGFVSLHWFLASLAVHSCLIVQCFVRRAVPVLCTLLVLLVRQARLLMQLLFQNRVPEQRFSMIWVLFLISYFLHI